jgi:hypothetical protein
MILTGKTELLGEIPVLSSLCSPQIQDSLARNGAWASTVKSGNWLLEWWHGHLVFGTMYRCIVTS